MPSVSVGIGPDACAAARLLRQRPGQLVYEPGHPDANADGYVEYPNVNAVEEMVNMITASRAYEAGVTAMRTASGMADRALSIGR